MTTTQKLKGKVAVITEGNTKSHVAASSIKYRAMKQRESIRPTLGDLIAAVTDEVTTGFGDSPATYVLVSYIVTDLLAGHRLPRAKTSGAAVV
jgi:hypothetical protein